MQGGTGGCRPPARGSGGLEAPLGGSSPPVKEIFGDAEIWKIGIPKIPKIKILKIKIRSAQNVGKVWISRKKNPPDPIWAHFLRGPEKPKNRCQRIFPWWAHGPLLPSTQGGAIGMYFLAVTMMTKIHPLGHMLCFTMLTVQRQLLQHGF